MKDKLKDPKVKELVSEYKKKYKGLNQRDLAKKNPSLLSKLRYRLGAELLATVVPKVKARPMTEEEKREYNRQYYLENKKEILASRKERYESDPKYRKAIARNTKKHRRSKRPVDEVSKRAKKLDPYGDI